MERIEVLYGPSSVSYGSDAIGGVVHYFTKIPEFSVEKKIDESPQDFDIEDEVPF